ERGECADRAVGNRERRSGGAAPLTVGTLPGTFPAAEFVQVFCARVRAAREARGMSRADMARKLEISRNAYGRYKTARCSRTIWLRSSRRSPAPPRPAPEPT